MKLLKKGYYLSASLFVITCVLFFWHQLVNNLSLFHPDTGPTAVFEICSIAYNLAFVIIQSFVVGHLCGCPYNPESIAFVAIFAICAFLFATWIGAFIASVISNSGSFMKIGIFCLISTCQTILLPAVIYFGERVAPKQEIQIDTEAARIKTHLKRTESAKLSRAESVKT